MNERNTYRALMQGRDICYYHIQYKTADLYIGAQQDITNPAMRLLSDAYAQVEQEVQHNPAFLHSLTPLAVRGGTQPVALAMYQAAQAANVGPMAAVAGAIAQYVSEGLVPHSPENIVENGGDLYLSGKIARNVLIHAASSPLSNKIALAIPEELLPISICTSSATIGHSLSMGKADAAIVIAKSGALADACASTLGNAMVGKDAIAPAIESVSRIEGVLGAVGIIGDALAAWGCAQLVAVE